MSEEHTTVTTIAVSSIIDSSESIMHVPQRWIRFLRRCLALRPGRYIIVVTVSEERCDWTVTEAGKVEK